MLQRCLYLLAAAVLLAGCENPDPRREESPPPDESEVELTLAGPQEAVLLVPVHVNEEGPFSFVLDTGATFTCIGPELRTTLGLDQQDGEVGFGAGIGGSGQIDMLQVDEIRVGQARVERATVCVVPLDRLEATGVSIDGLLGLNFLTEFHVSLDFDRDVLILR